MDNLERYEREKSLNNRKWFEDNFMQQWPALDPDETKRWDEKLGRFIEEQFTTKAH